VIESCRESTKKATGGCLEKRLFGRGEKRRGQTGEKHFIKNLEEGGDVVKKKNRGVGQSAATGFGGHGGGAEKGRKRQKMDLDNPEENVS